MGEREAAVLGDKHVFDNEVVVFRNQDLTPEQQIAFTRRFGVLEQHVRKEHRLEGYPEILIVSNVLNDQGKAIGVEDAGRFWHSDQSYKHEPSLLSALYAVEVPAQGGRVLGDTEDAWTSIFRTEGLNYPPPTLVLFNDEVASACGSTSSAVSCASRRRTWATRIRAR